MAASKSVPGISLSVVVCTHNRPASAARLVAALSCQTVGKPVELIVVDSASDENNRKKLATTLLEYPEVRLVEAQQKGVSYARNAGLEAVSSPWVAYIDDDEIPASNWVIEALALIKRLPDDCGACGGVVRPDFSPYMDKVKTRRPGARWRAFLGEMIREGEFDQTNDPQFGIGHSVVRVSALKEAGGFNTQLGRDGKSLLSGEEVLLIIQLEALGWRIWHSSTISVLHDITPDRLERKWARSRAYWEGISVVRIRKLTRAKIFVPALLSAIKTLPLALTAFILPAQYEIDMRIAFNCGYVGEAMRAFSNARSSA